MANFDLGVRQAVESASRGDTTLLLVHLQSQVRGAVREVESYASERGYISTFRAPNAREIAAGLFGERGGVLVVLALSTIETDIRGRTFERYFHVADAELTPREHALIAPAVRGLRAKHLTLTAAEVDEARFRIELRMLKGIIP